MDGDKPPPHRRLPGGIRCVRTVLARQGRGEQTTEVGSRLVPAGTKLEYTDPVSSNPGRTLRGGRYEIKTIVSVRAMFSVRNQKGTQNIPTKRHLKSWAVCPGIAPFPPPIHFDFACTQAWAAFYNFYYLIIGPIIANAKLLLVVLCTVFPRWAAAEVPVPG
eukprot:1778876-Rhodomonas_salina.2